VASTGAVLSLHRWPVKSMAGEDVGELELFEHGAVGDRQQALSWRGGRRLTARAAPRMLAWSARYNGGGDVPTVTGPDGRRWTWDEDGLEQAIAADLGKEVALVRDPGLMQDLGDSVLITFEATLRGLEAELGGTAGDLRRFRPNVHVELEMEPFAETGWEGRRVRIGAAELELLWPCARCAIVTRDPDTQEAWGGLLRHINRDHESIFGINARPLSRTTIRVGDPVEVL
jgi:hypothetical protein